MFCISFVLMKMKSHFNFAFAFNERSLQRLSEKYSHILLFAIIFISYCFLCLFRNKPRGINLILLFSVKIDSLYTLYSAHTLGTFINKTLAVAFFFPRNLKLLIFFNTVMKYCRHFGDKVEFENPSWTICVQRIFTTNDEHAQLCYVSHS